MSKMMSLLRLMACGCLLTGAVISLIAQERGGTRGGRKPENAYINNLIATSDPTYQRTNGTCAGLASSPNGGAVRFKTIQFTAPNAGSVTISLDFADGGSIISSGGSGGPNGPDSYLALYGPGAFNSASATTNCLAVNDDISGTVKRSRITTTVPSAGTYTVVISPAKDTPANSADDGVLPWSFILSIRGPASPIIFGASDFLISSPARGVVASFDPSLAFKGNLDAFLSSGFGIAAFNQGYAVAMDRNSHRVNVYNSQGSVVTTFTNAGIDGNTSELKVGTSGRYYGGGNPSAVKEYDQSGTVLRTFGAVGNTYASGIVVMPNNTMWAHRSNAPTNVDVFNLSAGTGLNIAAGSSFTLSGGQTGAASMTYCAARNSVIMSDTGGNVYERNATNGALLQTYNMAGVSPIPAGGTAYKAKFGATCGPGGNVYVMTYQDAGGESRIAVFNSAGVFQNTVDVNLRVGDALNILWLGNATTAAGVSVSGRVITADGRGVRNPTVILSDPNGVTRTVMAGPLGQFVFDDVEVGRYYTIAVISRRFSFTPQIVNVNDNVAGLEFVAGH